MRKVVGYYRRASRGRQDILEDLERFEDLAPQVETSPA